MRGLASQPREPVALRRGSGEDRQVVCRVPLLACPAVLNTNHRGTDPNRRLTALRLAYPYPPMPKKNRRFSAL